MRTGDGSVETTYWGTRGPLARQGGGTRPGHAGPLPLRRPPTAGEAGHWAAQHRPPGTDERRAARHARWQVGHVTSSRRNSNLCPGPLSLVPAANHSLRHDAEGGGGDRVSGDAIRWWASCRRALSVGRPKAHAPVRTAGTRGSSCGCPSTSAGAERRWWPPRRGHAPWSPWSGARTREEGGE